MARTPSTMLDLGTEAPDFNLVNTVNGNQMTLADFESPKGLLVMFICNHCPFVIHIQEELTQLASEYLNKGMDVVAINSNSIQTHPQDGPENMKRLAEELDWQFPFLFDDEQAVAKAYRAACTPDFYLFNGEHKLVYRGQLDASRPQSDIPVTGEDLRQAMDSLLSGNPQQENQQPSLGCNIKWHPGQAPDYFG